MTAPSSLPLLLTLTPLTGVSFGIFSPSTILLSHFTHTFTIKLLLSSSKDGSKMFGCHLCSNIVKCSRNEAINDGDKAQQSKGEMNLKHTAQLEVWRHLRDRSPSNNGAEPNLMLLIKSGAMAIKHFQILFYFAWLGWG